jgi:ABC-type polysaccharide transport system permease subunit
LTFSLACLKRLLFLLTFDLNPEVVAYFELLLLSLSDRRSSFPLFAEKVIVVYFLSLFLSVNPPAVEKLLYSFLVGASAFLEEFVFIPPLSAIYLVVFAG